MITKYEKDLVERFPTMSREALLSECLMNFYRYETALVDIENYSKFISRLRRFRWLFLLCGGV